MAEQPTTPMYPEPALRVAATYPASDGRVPEEIVLEFGGSGPISPALVDTAVNALARVAACRDAVLVERERIAERLAGVLESEIAAGDRGAMRQKVGVSA